MDLLYIAKKNCVVIWKRIKGRRLRGVKNSVALDILGAPAAFAKLNNATLERKCKWAQKRKLIAAKKERKTACLLGAPLSSFPLWKNFRIKRLPSSTLTPSFPKLWYKNFSNVSHFVAALNIRFIHYPWKLLDQNYTYLLYYITYKMSLKHKTIFLPFFF